jgi:hypothetical protein
MKKQNKKSKNKNLLIKLQNSLLKVNKSKLFLGICVLFMNIGSKYIQVKLSKSQEAFLRNYILRELIIFIAIFLTTRDIILSFILTASFFILSSHLFNENSKFCILPEKFKNLHEVIDTNKDGTITEEEIKKAESILKKANEEKNNK